MEDVQGEVNFSQTATVSHVQEFKPCLLILNAFARRIWGKFGLDSVNAE